MHQPLVGLIWMEVHTCVRKVQLEWNKLWRWGENVQLQDGGGIHEPYILKLHNALIQIWNHLTKVHERDKMTNCKSYSMIKRSINIRRYTDLMMKEGKLGQYLRKYAIKNRGKQFPLSWPDQSKSLIIHVILPIVPSHDQRANMWKGEYNWEILRALYSD